MFVTALTIILSFIALIYLFLIWNFGYWKKRGVNGPKPLPFLGNYPSVFTRKRSIAYDIDDIYREYKKSDDFVGIFSSRNPQLLVLNPELARRVYVTDFKNFHDNEASLLIDDKSDFLFANNPFALTGEMWKERRAEITPGFTANRVKTVYPVTSKICKKMTNYIKEQIRATPKDGIDTKDLTLRFTSEVVTDCVLGLNAESFAPKPTPILAMIKNIFDQSFVFIIRMTIVDFIPTLKRYYKLRFIPKPVEKFFLDLMQNAIDIRKSQEQKSQAGANERVDFLNYILQLREKKNLSTLQVTAHTMTFLLDGYETTASVITHCLLLLARNPPTLKRLRDEIAANLNQDGFIEFDQLSQLPYLDACVHESLRLFPPGLIGSKLCTEPIEFTNKNGKTLNIEKGQVTVLPVYSIMHDEDYYANAEQFEPERFLEENGGEKKYREMGLYYGFGDGPRVCLGMRFALVQAKSALVEIVNNFNIKVNPKTRTDNRLDPTYFLGRLDGGVWLDFETRN